MQARRLAVRREAHRRRRRWLAAAAGVALLVGAGVAATRTPLLAVHHVHLGGAVNTSPSAVLAATGLDRKPLMVDVDTGRLRARLQALPWVATATVRRQWPTTVDIRLSERTPVASAVGPGGRPALLDRGGRVLAVGGATGLPAIVGLAPAGPPGSSVPLSGGVGDALVVAASLPGAIDPGPATQVKAIMVAQGTLQLALFDGPAVILGGAAQLDAKLSGLRTIVHQVDLRGVTAIDLRIPEEPVLTRGGQGSTVSTTSRG
jgi:cell division protein FtsQ